MSLTFQPRDIQNVFNVGHIKLCKSLTAQIIPVQDVYVDSMYDLL